MPVQSAQDAIPPSSARLVWVRNRAAGWYEEEFKGQSLRIPPSGEKKVLLPIIEARHFLAATAGGLYEEDNDGGVKNMGKPLYTTELSDNEKKEHDPRALGLQKKDVVEKADKRIASRQASIGQDSNAELLEPLEDEDLDE